MYNCQCDRCGEVQRGIKGQHAHLPKDWFSLDFGVYPHQVHYQICATCKKVLGIPETAPAQTVAEKLLDILQDLISEEVEAEAENRPL